MCCISIDIDSKGNIIEKDRPCGADQEYMQYSKTINAAAQQKQRQQKRLEKADEDFKSAEREYNNIKVILERNGAVEDLILATFSSLKEATVAFFCNSLKSQQLTDFIHARSFNGETFQKSKICGNNKNKSLNKTLRKKQTAAEIEAECNELTPCLVWLAWNLRDTGLLKSRQKPEMNDFIKMPTPTFNVICAGPVETKPAADYLRNERWVSSLKSAVKGVNILPMDDAIRFEEMVANVKDVELAAALSIFGHVHQ